MMRKDFVVQRSHWILQPFVVKSSFLEVPIRNKPYFRRKSMNFKELYSIQYEIPVFIRFTEKIEPYFLGNSLLIRVFGLCLHLIWNRTQTMFQMGLVVNTPHFATCSENNF